MAERAVQVGMVVHVRRRPASIDPKQPEAGKVVCVHSPESVNIAGYDHVGKPFALVNVPVVQPGQEPPEEGWYAQL